LGARQYVHAVDGVSLSIKEEEILGIAGESGCGKSTLMKALYGSVEPPLTVVDGKVYFNMNGNKIDIFSLDKQEMKNIQWSFHSYIPQGSMNSLNPTIRIKSQFMDIITAHQKNVEKKETEQLMDEHIQELGLPSEVLMSYPHMLSGGMRQRVIIALATILRPRVIFADEPTTALDVLVQRGVLQMLTKVVENFKSTLVLITHDMGVQAQITDRIAIMYAGKIVELAPTEVLFENPYHTYTRYLINSLPKIGDKSRKTSIGGRPPSLSNPPEGCRFHPRCPDKIDICEKASPPLIKVAPDHYVACHECG